MFFHLYKPVSEKLTAVIEYHLNATYQRVTELYQHIHLYNVLVVK